MYPDGAHRVFFTPAGDSVHGQLFRADRPLEHGAGPVLVTSSGQLPGGLSIGMCYWVILRGAASGGCYFQLAASERNARNGVAVDITAPGSGLHLLTPALQAGAQA